MNTGVYQIKNLIDGSIYIGSTSNSFRARFSTHKRDLRNNRHCNQILQRAWNKYGGENFKFEILMFCNKEQSLQLEQVYLLWLNPKYNICKIAGSTAGITRSKEHIEALRASRIGNTDWKGRSHSDESKLKISLANKGKTPHTKGKPRTQETKLKISNSNKGKVHSKESIEKQRQAMVGRKPWNTGLKLKASWNKGIKASKEAKYKMSEAKKLYLYSILNIETGEIISTNSLMEFAKNKNLHCAALTATHKVNSRGKLFSQHKGYRLISKIKKSA